VVCVLCIVLERVFRQCVLRIGRIMQDISLKAILIAFYKYYVFRLYKCPQLNTTHPVVLWLNRENKAVSSRKQLNTLRTGDADLRF